MTVEPPASFYNTKTIKGFFSPTRIVAGPGSLAMCADFFAHCRSILLVVDRYFQTGPVVEEVRRRLGKRIMMVHSVCREPHTGDLEHLLAPSLACDGVLALGGGSTLDSAKALLARIMWGDCWRKDQPAAANRPCFCAVPTTAGTGSETSRYFVLFDDAGGDKRANRSWAICPDVAILDPVLLEDTPTRLIVLSAFDAFCHHWETMVCRNEKEPIVTALSSAAMADLVAALHHAPAAPPWPVTILDALQRAAALGGMALSNVRTGLIHKCAEGLAGAAPLSHAETLLPFFFPVVRGYAHAIRPLLDDFFALLAVRGLAMHSIEELLGFWNNRFEKCGILADVAARLGETAIEMEKVVTYVEKDHVLVKEHPLPLDHAFLEGVIGAALPVNHHGWTIPANLNKG